MGAGREAWRRALWDFHGRLLSRLCGGGLLHRYMHCYEALIGWDGAMLDGAGFPGTALYVHQMLRADVVGGDVAAGGAASERHCGKQIRRVADGAVDRRGVDGDPGRLGTAGRIGLRPLRSASEWRRYGRHRRDRSRRTQSRIAAAEIRRGIECENRRELFGGKRERRGRCRRAGRSVRASRTEL